MDIFTFPKINRYRKILATLAKYGFVDIVSRIEDHYSIKIPLKSKSISQNTYTRIRLVLEELGPTFVKFGQVLSLRTDLLPVELTKELSLLQDNVEPAPFDVIKKQIEDSLNKRISDIFDYIDPKPLAAGSLAQVHQGYLKKEETTVAIKIQRPGIEQIIRADLKIAEELAWLIHNKIDIVKVYNLPEIINELKKMILNELDFNKEVKNISIATHNFENNNRFYLPKVFKEYCSSKIIIMEKIHGRSLKESIPIMSEHTRKKTALLLIDILLTQILEHGFFHADPHPGNIFILNDNKICLLDWGMVGRIAPSIRFKLANLVEGIVKKDIDEVLDVVIFLCYPTDNLDILSLSSELQYFIDEYYSLPLKDIHMGRMLLDITNILRKHNMKIRPEIAVLIKSIVTSEGSGRLLYPEIDVISEVKPYITKLMYKRFSPEYIYTQIKKSLYNFYILHRLIPPKLDKVLDKIEQNKLSIGFEHKNLENLQKTLDRITNRMVLGLITASLIIGSSMIITTKIPPLLFGYPAMGLIGYVFSAFLGGWIIFDIIRKRKF